MSLNVTFKYNIIHFPSNDMRSKCTYIIRDHGCSVKENLGHNTQLPSLIDRDIVNRAT